ncbi:uncharacterized protein LOC125468921 [Pyrus x bretschneideri]|uniref:uncharacterized protein LOC125468921 n=1 Tax=Pyrus x bretschneideri TaxID=225117 RepID=UPI00202FF01E|nr:uncharacterized protein LOC125468921 [Pyrus x bretschneideri]XP_048421650.1 uncharacterized protein LOC125468921 [Pyrus x bretschneideri]
MIRNMPAYAKKFKELNTYKHKYEPHEKVMVSETVSAVLQGKLPPKLKDPGSFNININVGDTKLEKAMLDLGASINLMPHSIYIRLGLGELKPTTMSLQLADHSVKYPRGTVEDILVQVDKLIIVEDILVQVNKLIIPADFVVLDMEDAPIHDRELPILLGHPFMATAKTIIDVQNGKLTMTVLDETVEFKVFDSLYYPSNSYDCFSIDTLDSVVFSNFMQNKVEDKLEAALTLGGEDWHDGKDIREFMETVNSALPYPPNANPNEILEPSKPKLVPSIMSPPKLELKQLPSTLKYAYLGDHKTLPVIITSDLTPLEEEKLLRVLREHKTAIGWTIADIK